MKCCFYIILAALCGSVFTQCSPPPAVANEALITTGRYLFYDRRLSVNNTKACGSCHAQQFSFTDSYVRSIGAMGELHQRNARPLINLLSNTYFTSADSAVKTLQQQIANPMYNTHPVEMGITGHETAILKKIETDTLYQRLFRSCFPAQQHPFNFENIKKAIVAFEQTITAYNTPYDKYKAGDSAALTPKQKQGMQLFFSPALQCANCHGGNNFATPVLKEADGRTAFYQNIGLYNTAANTTQHDFGLFENTHTETDKDKFRVPTLRNLLFTAPYFHDGSAADLNQVLAVYERGGRLLPTGINKGDGKTNPHKNKLIKGFTVTLQQRNAIIDFLYSLTDSTVLTNPAYANPFTEDETKR